MRTIWVINFRSAAQFLRYSLVKSVAHALQLYDGGRKIFSGKKGGLGGHARPNSVLHFEMEGV